MKLPDKIFLAFDHGFVAQSSTSKKDINGNSIFLSKYNPIEYVYKDALLEKINEQIKMCEELKADGQGDVFYTVEIDAFEQTKRIIESLWQEKRW